MAKLSAIAFFGESEGGMLAWWTKCIAERMKLYEISVETIDFLDADWSSKLSALLKQRLPDFCFSFQGLGMQLANEAGHLWTALNIPFVSSMGDAPYWSPLLHNASGKTLAHLYASLDFQEFYLEFMKGRNFSAFVPFGYPSNPHASSIPWKKRDLELVFVKSGADPNAIRAAWVELPKLLREILEEASAMALAGQSQSIGKIVANALIARQIDPSGQTDLLMFSCQNVDNFVRATRADRMARQIMRFGGHIFGEWPYLDKAKSRATFHGRVPASKLNNIYARSRIMANTAPCILTGMHERILAAFQAKAFILADSSPYLEQRLGSYPSFKSAPIESVDFEDIFHARLQEIRSLGSDFLATQAVLDDVQIRADTEFGLDQFITKMFETLSVLKAGTRGESNATQG